MSTENTITLPLWLIYDVQQELKVLGRNPSNIAQYIEEATKQRLTAAAHQRESKRRKQ